MLLSAALLSSAALAAQKPARRDVGGVSLLLEVKADPPRTAQVVARTTAVIKKRCALLGIYCELRRPAGDAANRLALRYSTTMDAGRVRRILLAPGFELRPVMSMNHPFPLMEYRTRAEAEEDARPVPGAEVLPLQSWDGGDETFVIVERDPVVTGDDVRRAVAIRAVSVGGYGPYEVECRLSQKGGRRLRAWTRANLNRYVAVVYGGRAISAPYIRSEIWYDVVISGGYNRREAKDVAVVLGSGNLPAPVEVLEEGTYKP